MKKMITAALTLLFVCAGLITSASSAFAAEAVTYEPFKIDGTHRIEGAEDLKSVNNTFILTGKDGAPMPEGSAGGVLEIVSPANSAFSFGDIQVTKPGTYEYTVSRKIEPSDNLELDQSVYHVRVAVFSDGMKVTVLEKEGVSGKPDKIEYVDKYVAPEKSSGKSVKTGDDTRLYIAGAVFALAIIALIILVRKRRKD